MERIKDALEKAKKQSLERDAPSSRPTLEELQAQTVGEQLQNFDYSQTKKVPLNAEKLRVNRIIAHNKNNIHSGSFDRLRTHVLHKMEKNGWRTLAITSPTAGAGKTIVAINLAMSIAQHTERTALLVDFDLRRPSIANYLGLDVSLSVNDLLLGQCKVEDALINPDMPRLVILPTKTPVSHAAEQLASNNVQRLIADFRGRYEKRITIFDLPPLLGADDALAVLPNIDCVLMVVGAGMSSKREVQDCLASLPSSNIVGTVLNKSRAQGVQEYY